MAIHLLSVFVLRLRRRPRGNPIQSIVLKRAPFLPTAHSLGTPYCKDAPGHAPWATFRNQRKCELFFERRCSPAQPLYEFPDVPALAVTTDTSVLRIGTCAL